MAAAMLYFSAAAFGGEPEHGNATLDFFAAAFAAGQALFRQAGADQFFKIVATAATVIFVYGHNQICLKGRLTTGNNSISL
jgi:hypothetical protein